MFSLHIGSEISVYQEKKLQIEDYPAYYPASLCESPTFTGTYFREFGETVIRWVLFFCDFKKQI